MDDEQRDPLPERTRLMPGAARVGILAGAGVVAVLGAAVALGAATPAATPGAPATTGATDAATGLDLDDTGDAALNEAGWTAPSGETGLRAFGHMRGGGMFGAITITAVNGATLSLETANGWTRTITIGGDVTISKGGVRIAVAGLAVGDELRLLETRNDDGTFTLEGIVVVVPSVGGTVTAVDAGSITVQGRDGLTREITTTGSTVYRLGSDSTTRAAVTVGDRIRAFGETGAGDTFTATSVVIALPHVIGEVTAKSAGSFTLQLRDGSSVTVNVDADTVYRLPGIDDPGLDDIDVGDTVAAAGAPTGSTIDAQLVAGGPGFARDGDGGFGHGRGPGFGPGGGGEPFGAGPFDDDFDAPTDDTSQSS